MTPRKELFIKVKEALANIAALELIDLQRGQFDLEEKQYPNCYTAALIQIMPINYTTMVEHQVEGICTFHVDFYCKDGWMDQFNTTPDPTHGLIEIDVLDEITNAVQFLVGEQFKPVQLANEEELSINDAGIMSYRLTFSTHIYKRTTYGYTNAKLKPLTTD